MRTGLQWAQSDNGENITWAGAKIYAESVRLGGYSDWRLPTQDELFGLYHVSNPKGSRVWLFHRAHVPPGFRFSGLWYWASETRGSEAAYVNFTDGTQYSRPQGYSDDYRVRPVRVRV